MSRMASTVCDTAAPPSFAYSADLMAICAVTLALSGSAGYSKSSLPLKRLFPPGRMPARRPPETSAARGAESRWLP
jgi:hypothetical protein